MRKTKKKVGFSLGGLPTKENHFRTVSSGAHQLCSEIQHTDLVFYCQDEPVYAHKIMFLGKSDMLADYFRTTSEREYPGAPTQISLPGVNSSTFHNLIQYMYTGETNFESTEDKKEFLDLVKTFELNINIPQEDGATVTAATVTAPNASAAAPIAEKFSIPDPALSREIAPNKSASQRNEIVDALAEFTEELINGMTRAYYNNAKKLANHDNSRVKVLNIMSSPEYSQSVISSAVDTIGQRIAGSLPEAPVQEEQPIPKIQEQITEEVPKERKEKKRTSRNEEAPTITVSQSKENVETKKKDDLKAPVKSKVIESVVEKEVAKVNKPRGRPARTSLPVVEKPAEKDNDEPPTQLDLPEEKVYETANTEDLESNRSNRKRKLSKTEELKKDEAKIEEIVKSSSKRGRPPKASASPKKTGLVSPVFMDNNCTTDVNPDKNESVMDNNDMTTEKSDETVEAVESRKSGVVDDSNVNAEPEAKKGKRGRKSKEKASENALDNIKDAVEGVKALAKDPIQEETTDNSTAEEEYEIEKIVGKTGTGKKVFYLVKWKGYDDPAENTWEPIKNLKDTMKFVEEYESAQKALTADTKPPKTNKRRSSLVKEADMQVEKSDIKKDKEEKKKKAEKKKDVKASATTISQNIDDEATMCNICNRIFLSKAAFEVHVADEHKDEGAKPSEEPTKAVAMDVSFSDDEDDSSKTKKGGDIQNFDDLFGVLEEAPVSATVNKFIFNKDSDDESDSEMTSATPAAASSTTAIAAASATAVAAAPAAASEQKKEAEKPSKPFFSDETLTNGGDGGE